MVGKSREALGLSRQYINLRVTMKCKKIKYKAENDALLALNKIKKDTKRKIVPIRAYHCHCGAWHLTSRLDVKDIQEENQKLRQEISQLKDINKVLQDKVSNIINAKDEKILNSLKRDMMFQYQYEETSRLRATCKKLENLLSEANTKIEYFRLKANTAKR